MDLSKPTKDVFDSIMHPGEESMAHRGRGPTGVSDRVRSAAAWIWPYRIARIAVACLFIYGGVVKLFDPKAFARTISGYDLVPEMLLPVVAVGLPVIETVAGIGLLLDVRGSLAVIAGLLGMFVCVLGYGISLKLNVDCGCFGADDLARQAGLVQAFLRDLALGGLVVPYLYLSRWIRNSRAAKEAPAYNDGEQ
jgi:uncharacterized membrane protein YphA (DoxX/SURF4 family)